MKSALPILAATAVLFGASVVQAAQPLGAGGATTTAPAAPVQSSFGAKPGAPGSSTYDLNAALPSLDNQGSALSPTPGTSASGVRTPSTGSGG
jgi:hypothetical protein